MCSICGCASGDQRIEGTSSGDHHFHPHSSENCDRLPFASRRLVDIEMDVLAKNNHIASHNLSLIHI